MDVCRELGSHHYFYEMNGFALLPCHLIRFTQFSFKADLKRNLT